MVTDVGGILKAFTLNDKGIGGDKSNIFKIGIKTKNGTVAAQTSKYSVSLKKGAFANELANEGLLNKTDTGSTHNVVVTVFFNN